MAVLQNYTLAPGFNQRRRYSALPETLEPVQFPDTEQGDAFNVWGREKAVVQFIHETMVDWDLTLYGVLLEDGSENATPNWPVPITTETVAYNEQGTVLTINDDEQRWGKAYLEATPQNTPGGAPLIVQYQREGDPYSDMEQ